MASRNWGLGVAAAGVLAAVVGWQALRGERERQRPAKSALNHVWIERMPRDTRDMVRQFVAFETPRRRLGLAAASSHWRVIADRFTWQLNDDTLQAEFPQAAKQLNFTLRTWDCKSDAPEPFELCLELRLGQAVLTMYSREDWRIDPGSPGGQITGDVPVGVPTLALPDSADGTAPPPGAPSQLLPPAWR